MYFNGLSVSWKSGQLFPLTIVHNVIVSMYRTSNVLPGGQHFCICATLEVTKKSNNQRFSYTAALGHNEIQYTPVDGLHMVAVEIYSKAFYWAKRGTIYQSIGSQMASLWSKRLLQTCRIMYSHEGRNSQSVWECLGKMWTRSQLDILHGFLAWFETYLFPILSFFVKIVFVAQIMYSGSRSSSTTR